MRMKSVALLVLLATCAAFSQTRDLDKLRETRRVLSQPNGLYKAARMNGGVYVLDDVGHGFVVFDHLRRIAESSDAVVVGIPLERKVTLLIDEGRYVVTLYRLPLKKSFRVGRAWGRR